MLFPRKYLKSAPRRGVAVFHPCAVPCHGLVGSRAEKSRRFCPRYKIVSESLKVIFFPCVGGFINLCTYPGNVTSSLGRCDSQHHCLNNRIRTGLWAICRPDTRFPKSELPHIFREQVSLGFTGGSLLLQRGSIEKFSHSASPHFSPAFVARRLNGMS